MKNDRNLTDLHALRLIVADLVHIVGMMARELPVPSGHVEMLDRHGDTLADMIEEDDFEKPE